MHSTPNTEASPCQWSIAQRLPPELILRIQRTLVQAMYLNEIKYDSCFPVNHNRAILCVDAGQLDLIHTMKTCRSWYSPGTDVLYAKPYLISHRSIMLFARTLSEVPSLSRFVKDVFVVDREKPLVHEEHASIRTDEFAERKAAENARVKLIAALASCTSIQRLTTTHNTSLHSSIAPIDSFFIREASLAGRLKHLFVHGSITPLATGNRLSQVITDKLSLPHLETLSLHQVYIPHTFTISSLKSLHTVRFSQCVLWKRDTFVEPGFLLNLPPFVHTLELYQNSFQLTISDSDLSRLVHLYAIGHQESQLVFDWAARNLPTDPDIIPPPWNGLRHMSFGPIWPKSVHAPGITSSIIAQFPRELESLNLVVRLDTEDTFTRQIDHAMLRSVHSCLLFEHGLAALRRLSVTKMGFEGDCTIDGLRAFCSNGGISFVVHDNELNKWVTRRLLDSPTCLD